MNNLLQQAIAKASTPDVAAHVEMLYGMLGRAESLIDQADFSERETRREQVQWLAHYRALNSVCEVWELILKSIETTRKVE